MNDVQQMVAQLNLVPQPPTKQAHVQAHVQEHVHAHVQEHMHAHMAPLCPSSADTVSINQVPDKMKKIPETKAKMVRCGRMWPILLSTKPMNIKKRLTRGKGVEERIISKRREGKQKENKLMSFSVFYGSLS